MTTKQRQVLYNFFFVGSGVGKRGKEELEKFMRRKTDMIVKPRRIQCKGKCCSSISMQEAVERKKERRKVGELFFFFLQVEGDSAFMGSREEVRVG